MKKTDLVKFSLTLISAAVLAACSSGGSASKAAAQPEAQPEAPKVEEAPKAETETKDEAPVYELATESFGHTFVKKQKSNAGVDGKTVRNSVSSQTLALDTRLDPSLDAFVVGELKFQDKNSILYLEDFDLRGNSVAVATGEYNLPHIHVYDSTAQANDATGKNDNRTFGKGETRKKNAADNLTENSPTKTTLKGKATGKVLVYGENLDFAHDNKGTSGVIYANRNVEGSVAEVYGNRTFLAGTSEYPHSPYPAVTGNVASVNNAPYLTKSVSDDTIDFGAGQLEYVQYGRVTSSLNEISSVEVTGVAQPHLRKGIDKLGNVMAIASYGLFGQDGTENHYFYRTNKQTRDELKVETLMKDYKDGKVNYYGHAVTYGLDHSWNGDKSRTPNSPSSVNQIKSGTHVQAEVNLTDGTVKGNLYDVWNLGSDRENVLVKFQGSLNTKNGAISGESNLAYNEKDKGTFHANLFGANISEMGGAVKSHSTDKKDWGAVFGAKAAEAPRVSGGVHVKPQDIRKQ